MKRQGNVEEFQSVWRVVTLQGGPNKWGRRLMTIIPSNLNRFRKFFHWKILW